MVREKRGALEPAGREREASTLGTTYGRYQLLKKLATGGMAEVYLARQSGLEGFEKLVVVKRILPHLATDEEFVQMFLNEARIAARFSHANIVQIYDLGKIEGTYFIGMEYVHGEDLGRMMRKAWNAGTWLPPQLSLRIIAQACEGLYYAHSKTDDSGRPLNVVHRDISPQNILVSFDGGVKIVDFGIAKAADSSAGTRSGTIKGKYAYMSPEQAQGKPVDARTDVFALGLVLYELLTGARPLKRDSDIATLQAALTCEIEPPSKVATISETLDPLVMRALARNADDRYATARDFQMAIEDYLVENQLAASSVHLSEFCRTLFADRLEEERRAGRPMPSTESSQSIPVMPVLESPAPAPEEAPRRTGESRRTRAAPVPAEPGPEDPDDAPTAQEVQPRRKTGSVRRTTGEPRRSSSVSVPPSRAAGRSRVALQSGGMPEAPPRQASESRSRDESWKEANRPRAEKQARKRGSPLPAVLLVLAVAAVGGLYLHGDLQKLLAGRGGAFAPGASPAGMPSTTVTLMTNISVETEINGEVAGRTPIRAWPVKPGTVTVHYFEPAQGIDKTLTYAVHEGETFTHREDFDITRVQFKTDRAIQADVFLNGKRIGQTGAAPIPIAVGEYDFEARADNGTLTGTAHASLGKGEHLNFVEFKLRRK